MARSGIIRLEQVEIVILFFENSLELTLTNVIYTLECNSNLISLGQLQHTSILYHNHSENMVLKQGGKTMDQQ